MSKENFVGRRVAAFALAITIAAGGVGCDNTKIDPKDSLPTASVTGTFNPGESTTPIESASASTSTPIETETLFLAPDIAGLTKEIRDGEYVYLNKDGEYVGEFKKEVIVEGKEVGGVALIASEAQKILEAEKAKIPEGERNFKILLPLDITDLESGEMEVKIVEDTLTSSFVLGCFFTDKLKFVSSVPGSSDFLSTNSNVKAEFIVDDEKISLNTIGLVNMAAFNPNLEADDIFFNERTTMFNLPEGTIELNTPFSSFDYGKEIFEMTGPLILFSCDVENGNYFSIELNDILTVGENNSPVFVIANTVDGE